MLKKGELEERIALSLKGRAQREALLSAVKRGRDSRSATLDKLGPDGHFREDVQAIKRRCIERLPELVSEFTKKAEARGAKVYWAATGKEACDYVVNLAREKKARLITKSKSLTTEEIELNHPLEEAGIEVVETDLGERIIQMAGELPYHLVFPAVHKTVAQVAELFSEATGEDVEPELGPIMSLMRRSLRPMFLDADIGITGANVAIAETGSFLIETNEGNGRLVSSLPPVHVCVVGAEKIVETIEDAMKLVLAHPVSATGQILTTYVSIFAGRSPLGELTDRELHIVILDNGRLKMRSDPWFREALHCIRCGACMNICPTYGVVGGHLFGHIYPGPIGIPWTSEVHGLKEAASFSDLCISCGLCQEICPAAIDIPMMIAKVKHRALDFKPQPLANKLLMANEKFARVACATAPVSNWLLQSRFGKMVSQRLLGIDPRRKIPTFAPKPFQKQSRSKLRSRPSADKGGVALFLDFFAEYIQPELATEAIKVLEGAGAHVEVPKQKSSGYPYISYGELDKAQAVASYNVSNLAPFVDRGYKVVTLEPTAAYALKLIYPKLLDSEASQRVAEATFEFFEYLADFSAKGNFSPQNKVQENLRYGFHLPCHQRGLNGSEFTVRFLKSLGYDINIIETGTCCGMAGTFGLKAGPLGYDLSTTVGEPLFKLFQESGVEAILTESSVCKMQLEDGTKLKVMHPLELVGPILNLRER